MSESKKRDKALQRNGTAIENGSMSKNADDEKMSKMPKKSETSQKSPMAKSSGSGTNRESKKSSTDIEGKSHKNVNEGIPVKAIRAPTPTPEKKPEVHRTSDNKQASRPPVPRHGDTGKVN